MKNLSLAILLILRGIAYADSMQETNSVVPGVSTSQIPLPQPLLRGEGESPTVGCGNGWHSQSMIGSSSQFAMPESSALSTNRNAKSALTPSHFPEEKGTPTLPQPLRGYVPDTKYKLRVGDRIAFQILEDRDSPKTLTVADSGEVDLPYLGRMVALEKTCNQLAMECKALLEKDYYYQASIVIALDTANRLIGRVYVLGQVRNQGPLEMVSEENLTAGKAIIRAGGLGDFASKKRVKVVRGGNLGTGRRQTFELNMVEILEKGKTERDVSLEPDDLIIVPSRLVNF
jgi:polysaccharide export outer membrane protein